MKEEILEEILKELRYSARLFLIIFVPLVLLRIFVFEFDLVHGVSMRPNFETSDYIYVNKAAYWGSIPRRGDVVAVRYTLGDKPGRIIKRVIALPGDTVSLEAGRLYINGQPTDEPYQPLIDFQDLAPQVVPEGTVFLLGDNRPHSLDNRAFGPVRQEEIIGRVAFRLWPFDRLARF